MKNFQCKKCGTLVQSNSTPTSSGCPSGGFHSWVNLGETGSKNFQCKKCGTLVRSNNTPPSSGCPSENFHSWVKL